MLGNKLWGNWLEQATEYVCFTSPTEEVKKAQKLNKEKDGLECLSVGNLITKTLHLQEIYE